MKQLVLILALVCCATIAQAQSLTTTGDWTVARTVTGSGALPTQSITSDYCIETVKSFSLQDGRIMVEKNSVCHPNATPTIACYSGPCDFTRYRQWRETYGLGADGTLQLLKTEEATRVPAQAERWEYPKEEETSRSWCCISTQKQLEKFTKLYGRIDLIPGEGVSIAKGDGAATITIQAPKAERKGRK